MEKKRPQEGREIIAMSLRIPCGYWNALHDVAKGEGDSINRWVFRLLLRHYQEEWGHVSFQSHESPE